MREVAQQSASNAISFEPNKQFNANEIEILAKRNTTFTLDLMQEHPSSQFGLTLLVDKPYEWTSFDVVNKIRYAARGITGYKKIKVGHAGTLDPLATGLLIVCVGKHTKQIEQLVATNKAYEGTFILGATTPSFDLETKIDKEMQLPKNDPAALADLAGTFIGEQEQIPPIYSAKKIGGKKAYALARQGKTVEMKPSTISIGLFELDSSDFPNIGFKLECSKGTYVRSLVRDFGEKAKSGAHLTRLRRSKVGAHSITSSRSIDEAIDELSKSYDNYLSGLTE